MKNSLIWQHALSISYYCRHPEENLELQKSLSDTWTEEEKKKSPRDGEEDISLFLYYALSR